MASSPVSPISPTSPNRTNTGTFAPARRRATSVANSVTSVSSSARNFTEDLVLHRDPPLGFLAATAQATSSAPTIRDIRRGSFGRDGWQGRGSVKRKERRESAGSAGNVAVDEEEEEEAGEKQGGRESAAFATVTEEATSAGAVDDEEAKRDYRYEEEQKEATALHISTAPSSSVERERTDHDRIPTTTTTPEVTTPPPSNTWIQSTLIALKSFWRWFLTPLGFLITLYGLNVVAWGGMLFLLLCNAAPAMCHAPVPRPSNQRHVSPATALGFPGPYYFNCNDINSPRRIWIEIDSQILNALFCVTGFGLVPWRFRDLYYLLRWRFASKKEWEKKVYGLRVLAGIHRGWFRLPGSETLDEVDTETYLAQHDLPPPREEDAAGNDTDLAALETAQPHSGSSSHDPRIPFPVTKIPPSPPTGTRAPPTSLWKLDFFVWAQCWNTFFQCCLCGFMWGENRYERPPWSTGLFVALACIVVGVAGIMSYREGKGVKKVEGVVPKVVEGAGEEGEVEKKV